MTATTHSQANGRTPEDLRAALMELAQLKWTKYVDVGYTYLRNREDAEDCVQRAFVKAHQHLDQFQGAAQFSTWFRHIVVNECLLFLRRPHQRAQFTYLDQEWTFDDDLTVTRFDLPCSAPNAEEYLAYAQLTDALRAEIRRMPPLLRNPLLFSVVHDLSRSETAYRLDITVSAFRSRQQRARAELRTRMVTSRRVRLSRRVRQPLFGRESLARAGRLLRDGRFAAGGQAMKILMNRDECVEVLRSHVEKKFQLPSDGCTQADLIEVYSDGSGEGPADVTGFLWSDNAPEEA
jgi:RNA polymerase sigma factor (sigma-70 family)